MPVNTRIVGEEVTEATRRSPADTLAEKLLPVIHRVRSIQIARYRPTKNSATLLKIVEVQLEETEDKEVIAHVAARDAWQIAVEDANGKRTRYLFTVQSEGVPGKKPPELFAWDAWCDQDDDGDDPPTNVKAEAALLVRESRSFIKDVGSEYVRVLKEVNGLVNVVSTSQTKLAEAIASSDAGKWKAEEKKIDTEFAKEKEAAGIFERLERSKMAHDSFRAFSKQWAGIGEALLSMLLGKAMPGSEPTAAEIDKIFAEQEDLRQVAHQIIKPENQPNRAGIAKVFRLHWFALDKETQGKILTRAMFTLGEARGIQIAAWVRDVMKEAKEASGE